MRIQVLPLPEVVVGDARRTPFVLVVDEIGPEASEPLIRGIEDAGEKVGAEGVLAFGERIEVV